MDWDQAWAITQQACAYTNHTLLAEALEKWPVPLFGKLLPRHLEIIYEINRRFLDDLRRRHPEDEALLRRLSLIDETGDKYVRMAHLASVGSHAINGVAALHTELLKQTVLRDFYRVSPGEVLQRHQRRHAAALDRAEQSEAERAHHPPHRRSVGVEPRGRARAARAAGRRPRLPGGVARGQGRQQAARWPASSRSARASTVDPHSLFDIQVKRLHEYKRQHLNVLYLITLYNRLRRRPATARRRPRTVIFGGKAAPGYRMAKLIIRLINARRRRRSTRTRSVSELLKVVFLPDFNVKSGQRVYPGRRSVRADLDGRQGGIGHRQHEVRA